MVSPARAVAGLLAGYGVHIEKALNPLNHDDFVVICDRLNRAIIKAVGPLDQKALDAAVRELDVDWAALDETGKSRVIDNAKGRLRAVAEAIAAAVLLALSRTMDRLAVQARRRTVEQFSLGVPKNLSDRDLASAEHLLSSHGLFIVEEYERRAAVIGRQITEQVTYGLAAGLSSSDLVESIAEKTRESLTGRTAAYWGVLATAFPGHLRSAVQINTLAEASVETFEFVSDLCATVSDICSYMHGRRFSVGAAEQQLRRFEEAETVDVWKDLRPWVSRGRAPDGNNMLYYKRDGVVRPIVEIAPDGTFVNGLDTWALEQAGILIPPLHGCCHSSIVAV